MLVEQSVWLTVKASIEIHLRGVWVALRRVSAFECGGVCSFMTTGVLTGVKDLPSSNTNTVQV
jgi:hypothetical protein